MNLSLALENFHAELTRLRKEKTEDMYNNLIDSIIDDSGSNFLSFTKLSRSLAIFVMQW